MKVFKFDPKTGTRGKCLGYYPACRATANSGAKLEATLPARQQDEEWSICDAAQYQSGSPIIFNEPVCFCLGYLACGTDKAWHWVVLLPQVRPAPREGLELPPPFDSRSFVSNLLLDESRDAYLQMNEEQKKLLRLAYNTGWLLARAQPRSQ